MYLFKYCLDKKYGCEEGKRYNDGEKRCNNKPESKGKKKKYKRLYKVYIV